MDPLTPQLAVSFEGNCPDENTLARFALGRGQADMPALEAHLDRCESCRRSVAAAASDQTLPPAPHGPDLGPGQRVGRYEIERELGRGGMGVVYQARDVTLDRRVALKLLHARRDEVAQARLLREAQVMAKLAHPNVVPVFELGEVRGEVYLVMELVGGTTLDAWLKAAKRSRRDILSHFVDAGRGLAAAHAAGVVHRDFKPANVLVGADGRVRVTDFGLSRPGPALALPLPELRPSSSAHSAAIVTREGVVVGTLAYMAPEQLDGNPATEASDQFAFCVALAEALSGVRPFAGANWSTLAVSHAGRPELKNVIPARLRAVLRRGLERDPQRRYTSMSALLAALERAARSGWTPVALTGALAAAAVAFMVANPLAPAPQPVAVAAAPSVAAETLVPVVMAARDLEEGTVLTMDMVEQRAVPETYVTSSVVRPDAVSYVVNQKVKVPMQKGDMLLWTAFETTQDVQVLVAAKDLPAGAVVKPEQLKLKTFPGDLVTASQVRAEQRSLVAGGTLLVPLAEGDALQWNFFKNKKAPPRPAPELEVGADPALIAPIAGVLGAHLDDIETCVTEFRKKAPPGLEDKHVSVEFRVDERGKAVDVAVTSRDLPGDASALACIGGKLKTWQFEAGKPTELIRVPIVF